MSALTAILNAVKAANAAAQAAQARGADPMREGTLAVLARRSGRATSATGRNTDAGSHQTPGDRLYRPRLRPVLLVLSILFLAYAIVQEVPEEIRHPLAPAETSVAPVAGAPATWITTDDYPPEAIMRGEQGQVRADLTVDPGGRVSDCVVSQSSGHVALDTATCRLLSDRARYAPSPASHRKTQTVMWRLPE